ncbi:diaminopimelate decarboxylase [Chloroflexota bacterium]
MSRLVLFPLTAEVNSKGHLMLGGCDTVELATKFGTPLYVFDEFSLRSKCRDFKEELRQRYTDSIAIYACKAFVNKALLQILKEEGMGLDTVSGGELGIAQSVGFPLEKVYFHGNNKSAEEIRLALDWHVGRIVVDNLQELKLLGEIAKEQGYTPDILLRLSPGVNPHTHRYNTTGMVDSKFGIPLIKAEEALIQAISMPHVKLIGLHFHIGSSIFKYEPYQEAIERILDFSVNMKQKHGFELKELSVGGGFAIQYTLDTPVQPFATFAEAMLSKITSKCQQLGLALPRIIIEPGRAVVGQAGVALYNIGVVKDIPGVRCYVSVDGGMADNIRHALYGAKHEAMVANKMREADTVRVTIAGKFCESGDILIQDINLPPVSAGDKLAIADCGAYCLSMASNYNASLKPAVVLVKEGKARLIRRRETLDDLLRYDLI